MRKLIITLICLSSLILSGCTHILKPYRPPVQQGNIITDDMVKQLKVGMTKQQVAQIMGSPVLIDPFDKDTWTYVYTFQPSKGPSKEKQLTICFKNNRADSFVVDLPPPKKLK